MNKKKTIRYKYRRQGRKQETEELNLKLKSFIEEVRNEYRRSKFKNKN